LEETVRLSRFLVPFFLAAGLCAPAPAATPNPASLVAQATASVSGTVTDTTGAPVSGAGVLLTGPTSYSTTTNGKGAFAISNVAPGVYTVSISKAGYNTAVQNDIALVAGQSQTLTVSIAAVTFSSLRTIAHVSVNGRGAINQTAASIDVVQPQTFIDQAAPQVTRVLSQIPGLQISFPSNSANAAAPGAITIPNIRDATSYETASLIDGHYISVGQYGDNVTTFIDPFVFGSVEVIKGPGAESPVVNNAIGGTVNFHTKDPTLTPEPQFIGGFDNRGGSFADFGFSDTIDNRLGIVIAIATDDNPSAANGHGVYYDPSSVGNSYGGSFLNGNASATPVGHTLSFLTTQFPLLACCYPLRGFLDESTQLVKLQYHFSSATRLTVSYLGSQAYSDQNVNTSDFVNGNFVPGGGYTGPLSRGPIQVTNVFPGAFSGEFNNEPIFQAELSTTVGNDSLIARYYHVSIERYQFQGSSPLLYDFNNVTLYGTSFSPGFSGTFNGTGASVGYNDFYQEPEIDKLAGGSFEWNHPFAERDMLTVAVDRTVPQSIDYSVFAGPFYSFNLPPGGMQDLTTYLARGHFYFGSKWDVTVSDYYNTYSSTYAIGCVNGATTGCSTQLNAEFGEGIFWHTTKLSHNDPRIGIVYRPNLNASLRFAAGSSIAPPFLGLLNQVASTPLYQGPTVGYALESESNTNLKPETGFGYDVGGDYRFNDGLTIVSADGYLTNLYNRFFGQLVNTGLTCNGANCPSGTFGQAPAGTPILNNTNTNISNARFEGVELSISRNPQVGFGFVLEGALERGYYYDLPPGFYCSFVPTPTNPCIPTTYNQNLNIVAGQNTNGITVGNYPLDAEISYNGNMRIPYSQGNAAISYTFPNQVYALVGDTYYGNNNSLNEPAFGIAYATLRVPVSKLLAIQVSGDNIFNAYPGYLPTLGTGVPIPLANNWTGATTGNVLGPATYRFMLMTRFQSP
jgi:outer membrane receptor protein involved in Fe transport